MILNIRKSSDVSSSEITPERVYHSRREFLTTAAAGVAGAAAATLAGGARAGAAPAQAGLAPLKYSQSGQFHSIDRDAQKDPLNSYQQITNYNNFYEFGTGKTDPVKYAGQLKVSPWTVKVDGLVKKPGNYGVEDLVDFNALEERIYRHRCVEAWSMVIPWIGVPLASVLKKVEPEPKATFVEFTTLMRPSEMLGEREAILPWPYVEGLRIDEAMHPLTLMVVGLYGKVLPNQDGAPLRVHIPWKYGFKSGKSIVRIRLTDSMPNNTWHVQTPNEYGFYANVNPNISHPRWSQASERRIGELFQRKTLLFNGYGDQVAHLYPGDLQNYY